MFSEHGSHKLWVEDDLLIIHAFGAWNLEQCEVFRAELLGCIDEQLHMRKWACIVVLHDWFLTYDGIMVLAANNQYALDNGMICEAYVPCDEVSASLLDTKILPKDSEDFNRKRFESEQEAREWGHQMVEQTLKTKRAGLDITKHLDSPVKRDS